MNFCDYPLKKGVALYLSRHESTLPKDMCQVLVKLADCFGERIWIVVDVILLLSPLGKLCGPRKRAGAFSRRKLKLSYSRMHCVKFGLNCPRVLGKNIFKCSQYIFAYLLLRAWSFIWTNLNPLHLKDTYFQVWWKLSQWFLKRWKCYGQTEDGQ